MAFFGLYGSILDGIEGGSVDTSDVGWKVSSFTLLSTHPLGVLASDYRNRFAKRGTLND